MEIQSHNILVGALFGGGLSGAYVLIVRARFRQAITKGERSPFVEDILRLPGHGERIRRTELLDSIAVKYDQYLIWSLLLIATSLLPEPLLIAIFATPCIAGVAYVLYQSTQIHSKLQSSILKCDGEEYTGQELNHLWREGAEVYHDIPYDGGNIDHLIVGHDKILVVETLTVNKVSKRVLESTQGSMKVTYDGKILIFPHLSTTSPMKAAKIHAAFITRHIENACGFKYPVKPVVAVPGWHVDIVDRKQKDLLVVNPKRGHGLRNWLGKKDRSHKHDKVRDYLASVARSIPAKSHRTDSDASSEFEFWLSPRYKDKIVGD